MTLSPDEVHCWCWPLDDMHLACKLGPLLSAEEQHRAARFHALRDKVAYTVAHGQLRRIIADCLQLPPAALRFERGRHGKPYLVGDHPVQFNLSHSTSHAVLAIASTEVGADIECIASITDQSAMRDYICSEQERADLQLTPESHAASALARLWVRKEAWLKARGVGLLEDPSNQHVGGAEWGTQWQPLGGDGTSAVWWGADVSAPIGHMASIVVQGRAQAAPRLITHAGGCSEGLHAQ
ncbi:MULTISPECIES: 4'-phosphopantetheinyl transferase superfamily protein [Stenotrophomonas]|uniref:4'-phosphopantetheinyl transferase family protein n=1 Tax=Stenotrophomonas TaxID=40323 RepID=UPI00113102A3|nr:MULTISPECIES: 4'-phosphopantetheinyl transferase superfamily protein [Stenotrophomonas]